MLPSSAAHTVAGLESRVAGEERPTAVGVSTRQQVKCSTSAKLMYQSAAQLGGNRSELSKGEKHLGDCFKGSQSSSLSSVPFMCLVKAQKYSISSVGLW